MNKLPAILAVLRATAPAQPNIVFLLAAAPAESKMLAAQHPDLVKQLCAKVEARVATQPKKYLKTTDQQD